METSIDKKLAKALMDIKAVLLRPQEPFTWASGWHSPIYCDNRRILSHPELRAQVAQWLADKAMEDPCKPGNPREVTKEDFIKLYEEAM